MKAAVAILAILAAPLVLIGGLLAIVVCAAGGAANTPSTATALADLPADLLPVYRAAAASCPLPWPVLAAIGKIETDHGRADLPGVHAGQNSAGAEGPLQFLPATWAAYGVDADGDGTADVYGPVDAIWGAARMLCANGGGDPATLPVAVFSYNHADWYVSEVMRVAAGYAAADERVVSGDHASPVAVDWFRQHPDWLSLAHHGYPAIDIPVPVGTAVFAAAAGTVVLAAAEVGPCGGTVIIEGGDGPRYTYCHLSTIAVTVGQRVVPGNPLGTSGGQPGSPGAGDSTGPHLHFGIAVDGLDRCPQPVLAAWANGQPYNPATAPASGCTT